MAYASSNYTEIKTRIIIRNDTSENWEGSTIVLEKGEPAIEYDAVNKTAKIKFGDGVSKFSELPFSTLTPSEVNDLIDSIEAGGAQITTVTTSGDGNAVTGGSISDDGTTLTLTKGTEFVPASGGIFSGDVTVSGDLTVDNIKTSGEISIIPTTNITLSNDQYHDISKLTFVNTNKCNSDDHISIEAKYRAAVAGDHHVYDYHHLTINHVDVGIDGCLDVKNSINGLYLTSSKEWIGDYGQAEVYSLGPHDYGDNAAKIRLLRRQPNPGTYTSQIELNADHVVLSNAPTSDMDAATKKYVDDSVSGIVSAVDAMKFKGTIGTSGTVADIASISSPSTGDTYKIITASTLTSEQSFDSVAHDLTVGDLVVYASNKWVFVPSGNEDVTTVKVAGSGDTINVSTTAQTGALVLGTAAGVNTTSTVTDSATTVPTTSAVKTYVDDSVSSISTDSLTDGENILILNGGSATE